MENQIGVIYLQKEHTALSAALTRSAVLRKALEDFEALSEDKKTETFIKMLHDYLNQINLTKLYEAQLKEQMQIMIDYIEYQNDIIDSLMEESHETLIEQKVIDKIIDEFAKLPDRVDN